MDRPFAPSPGPRLKPIEVPGLERPVDLVARGDGPPRLTVGRGADNDLVLDPDRFPSVSTAHARFDLVGGTLRVTDLGSRNGVLVNGEPIRGAADLEVGDQVRLGAVGPRFLVVGGRGLADTVFVKHADVVGERVEHMVERGSRRTVLRVAAVLVVGLGAALWYLNVGSSRRARTLDARLARAAAEIAVLETRSDEQVRSAAEERTRREERIRTLEANLEARTVELRGAVDARGAEEERLMGRIEELEADGASLSLVEEVRAELARTRSELESTRAELDGAKRRMEMLDPVNLAQTRVQGLRAVLRSIVLIENVTRVRDRESGAFMHVDGFGPLASPNFDGVGEELALESTGSGFCVDAGGWILTNAHVVSRPESKALDALTATGELELVHELRVVFSGTAKRHPGRVTGLADGGVDLALVKIEPFDAMPWLETFATDVPSPEPGSDIYLFGFPLGHLAVQEGETVIASTFRGILSRNVGGQVQVDAGVHPGNSGGPITDSLGRVIGVVESVQAGPDRSAVYTIGYGIPVREAARLWPPADPAR